MWARWMRRLDAWLDSAGNLGATDGELSDADHAECQRFLLDVERRAPMVDKARLWREYLET